MASAADDLNELKKLEQELALLRQVNAAELDRMNQSISAQVAGASRLVGIEHELGQERANVEKVAKRLARLRDEERRGLITLTQEEKDRVALQEDFVTSARKELDVRQQQIGFMRSQLSLSKAIGGELHSWYEAGKLALLGVFAAIPGYLIQTDSLLRSVAKNTGMGGENLERMRLSLQEGALSAARLGATTRELGEAQGAYVDQTGRLQVLSGQALTNISAIAEGTHLGYENGAKLAGEMGKIGYSVADTKKWTERVVNDTERMGLNSGKVLQNITALIDRASTFSFQNGMGQGLVQMAQQAEKLKLSVEGTFAAADKARTLEGSLAMASQLMVLGGNFSKADPFQLSFLARNDPAKFQVALADMTKGMATFNSQTGELEVSAYNMDRLRAAAEATGQPLLDLVNASKRAAEIGKMSSQLFVGTKEQRDTIMTMATLGRNGRATISIEGKDVDLAKLTQAQAGMLMSEKTSLETRAKQAQDFDKSFGIFASELKATALPLLNGLNTGLKYFHNVLDSINGNALRWVAGLSIGAFALSKAFTVGQALLSLGGGGGGGGGLFSSIGGFFKNRFGGGGGAGSPLPGGGGGSLGGGASGAGGIGSFSSAATMAATGVAAVGIGYGFKLAAEGAGAFAKSLEKLNPQQLDAMQGGLTRIGLGIGGIVVAAAALGASGAGPVAIGVLLGVGAAVTTIGYGVKLATEGVGGMMKSISQLGTVDLGKLGGFFNTVTGFLGGDTSNLDKLVSTVNALSVKSESILVDRIEELIKTPLKLDTSSLNIVINNQVNTNIDGQKFTNHFAKRFAAKIEQARQGGGSLQ